MSKKFQSIFAIVFGSVLSVVIVVTACVGTLIAPRYSEGIVPTAEDVAAAVPYQRVLLFGVDGAGNYFADVDTPNFDRIFGEGSINYDALSQFPTISAQNWTSILHGVRCQKHGVTNLSAARHPYNKAKYPSVFKVYADLHPDASMISLTPWYPINYGIIEDLDGLIKYNGPKKHEDDPMLAAEDEKMKNALIRELRNGLDPKIAFMYFAQIDEYGHANGRDDAFVQAMQRVDGYIGEVYDQYVASGYAEDTLFVFVTDHGHKLRGGHGGNSQSERTVTIAVAGAKGNIIKGSSAHAVTQDVASIILYGLGIRQPDSWESMVPYGIFNTLPTA